MYLYRYPLNQRYRFTSRLGKSALFSFSLSIHILGLFFIKRLYRKPPVYPLETTGGSLMVYPVTAVAVKTSTAADRTHRGINGIRLPALQQPAPRPPRAPQGKSSSFNQLFAQTLRRQEKLSRQMPDKLITLEIKAGKNPREPAHRQIGLSAPLPLKGKRGIFPAAYSHKAANDFKRLPLRKVVFNYTDQHDDLRQSFLNQIMTKIKATKRYPRQAKRRGIEGTTWLKFRLSQNGMVADIVLLASSGSKILDQASLNTVRKASPFPYIKGWLKLNISYSLKE